MKKYIVAAMAITTMVLSTTFVLPFVVNVADNDVNNGMSQAVPNCEPFPDCVIYHVDQSPQSSEVL